MYPKQLYRNIVITALNVWIHPTLVRTLNCVTSVWQKLDNIQLYQYIPIDFD